MEPAVRVCVEQRGPAPILVVIGEFDAGGAHLVDAIVREVGAVGAVDARYVTFIDAAGVGSLLRASGGRPVCVAASRAVRRVIGICDLETHLVPVAPTTRPALDAAPFGILEIAEDDTIAYVNEPMGAHLGLDPGALEGTRWTTVLALARLRDDIGRARVPEDTGRARWRSGTAMAQHDPSLPDRLWTVLQLDRPAGSQACLVMAEESRGRDPHARLCPSGAG